MYILSKISNIFFIFNHQNYARWLVKYEDNLKKVDESHPGLSARFESGSFGVKRTNKPFSRQPVDLTLEQTINADAARRLTGVIQFTNSISARQRWAKSHGIRSMIISHVYDEVGMKNNQDVASDLKQNQINISCNQIKSFIGIVNQNLNPFERSLNEDVLYNISTGQSVSENVTDFLINIEESGHTLREQFISERAVDSSRFESPIKKNKILTFSNMAKKKQVRIMGKVQEVRMQRDLFGRLLGVSMDQKLDLEKVLTYPLTPVPLSLCHLDETICKTDKSVLLKSLEGKIKTIAPSHIDIVIVDGFFILHTLKELPKTFGNISKKILQTFTKYSSHRIDIIFDRYFSPSIKDNEHILRSGNVEQRQYHISGPNQVRPASFEVELKNNSFKEALISFLISHWSSDEMAPFFINKTVYLNYDVCYKYEENDGKVIQRIANELSCERHEEADTKIIYHVCQNENDCNILIRCSDTDVLIIMLGNMQHMNSASNIYMNVGVGNNCRYINVSEMYRKVGNLFCSSLPGFHALTGCDYNPAFYRKGKKRPLKLLESSERYQKACSDLGDYRNNPSVFMLLEEFICRVYGLKTINDVNKARFDMFTKTFKPKDVQFENFNTKIKNYDSSNLPPCKSELHQQLLRAAYITSVWKNAHLTDSTNLQPVEHGWFEKEGKYSFIWFESAQLPEFINDVVLQPENVNDKGKLFLVLVQHIFLI